MRHASATTMSWRTFQVPNGMSCDGERLRFVQGGLMDVGLDSTMGCDKVCFERGAGNVDR